MNYEQAVKSGTMARKWLELTSKVCRHCGEEKPIQEFVWVKYFDMGVFPVRCRSCDNAISRLSRKQFMAKVVQIYGETCVVCGEHDTSKLRVCPTEPVEGELRAAKFLYRFLKKNKYPKEGYVVKCWTCWGESK